MRISSKADYAVRASVELAVQASGRPVRAEDIAQAQDIPLKFLLNILAELRRAGVVTSRRGIEGGFQLARDPSTIKLADVFRAVEGPLANIHESRPEELEYEGAAKCLPEVWIAVRASLRDVLERVSVADVASCRLPEHVVTLAGTREARISR